MRIPPSLKLQQFNEKFVLKRAARGLVPAEIAAREKFPFTAPSSPYLVRRAREFVHDWLSPDVIRRQGIFDAGEVQRMCAQYEDPDYRLSTPLRTDWLMLVLTFTMLAERTRRASSEVMR
jgi:asparagine synthase (glutamine-hydrolysing)